MLSVRRKSVPRPADHIAALEHERLISLINSMADAVIATDERQVVAVYNGAALNILDLNSELKGKRLKSLIKLIDRNKLIALFF